MKIFRRKEGGLIVFLPFRSGRPRVGGDQGHAVGLAAGLIISTHAPAWGATRGLKVIAPTKEPFLLTPPRGGRR